MGLRERLLRRAEAAREPQALEELIRRLARAVEELRRISSELERTEEVGR